MNERQEKLLNIIISQYIKTAQPVGSKLITETGGFDLSSATIRNEMAELEEMNYIVQPHTSAGRMPTEKGYRFYAERLIQEKELNKKHQDLLNNIFKSVKSDQPELIKDLAKAMAEISTAAVFVGFSPNNFYYTGLSNLFSQPEFVEHNLVCHVGRVVDQLDRIINSVFDEINDEVKIMIGSHNPFGRDCSVVVVKSKLKREPALLGILGPLRMDYQNNYNLIKYTHNLISNLNR